MDSVPLFVALCRHGPRINTTSLAAVLSFNQQPPSILFYPSSCLPPLAVLLPQSASPSQTRHPYIPCPTSFSWQFFTFVDKEFGFLSMENKCWQLGRVCHRWRAVVEESPFLWTDLDVPLAEASTLRDPAALLHHALRLTKGQGLNLLLDFGMETSAEEDDIAIALAFTAMELFTILVAHASCWREVVLNHFSETCWLVLSKTVGSTTLAKLETLIMTNDTGEDSDDEDEDDSGDEDEDWVPNAPLLERIVIHSVYSLACGPFHPQLKEFTILDVIYNVSLASLLQTAECLEVLWVQQFDPTPDGDSESDLPIEISARVTSSSLLHLRLDQNVEDLNTVDLPNLRSLIAGDPLLMGSAAPYLQSIFELVRGNLLEILKLLPILKMLRINFGHIQLDDAFNGNVDRVLSSLTSALGEVDKESEAFTLVPDLEELRVDFYDGTKIASAFEWTFYTPKVEADFGMRRRRNGFTASCTFKGKPYFGVTLPGHCASWISIPAKPHIRVPMLAVLDIPETTIGDSILGRWPP
ncbi:hypothetical protein BDZ89DRAFT_1246386 [Hymenopellis radicata]|nr:hypothetical protein BDZ89DRAFT_1246386 [Hymenopellis radicata]